MVESRRFESKQSEMRIGKSRLSTVSVYLIIILFISAHDIYVAGLKGKTFWRDGRCYREKATCSVINWSKIEYMCSGHLRAVK